MYTYICDIEVFFLTVAGGKQTVLGIMGMMDSYIVDMEREMLLVQLILQEIQLVVA